MPQTVQFVLFHGNQTNKLYHVLNTSGDQNNIQSSQRQIHDQLQQDPSIGSQIVNYSHVPVRFKRQDNDIQDLQNPIPIPDTQGVTSFSYRKIMKLQVVVPQNETSGQLMNLRFYVDTGQQDQNGNQIWDQGVYLYLQTSNNFLPQSEQDQQQSVPFNGEIQQESQLQYTQDNMKVIYPDVFIDKTIYHSGNVQGELKFFGQKYNETSQSYVPTQPYLYLQIGLTSEQQQGKVSNIQLYYVYDEI